MKNLISEKHKYVENNNLYSRLMYYNMKKNTYNDILYWLKIVYFILFFVEVI